MTTLFEQARERVERTPELLIYRDIVLHDWVKGDAHWQWVLTASIAELVDWAAVVAAAQEEDDDAR